MEDRYGTEYWHRRGAERSGWRSARPRRADTGQPRGAYLLLLLAGRGAARLCGDVPPRLPALTQALSWRHRHQAWRPPLAEIWARP